MDGRGANRIFIEQVYSTQSQIVRKLGKWQNTPFYMNAELINITRGNAFALFLKSQRKWDNPPLQDNIRDQFRKMCAEQNYDAAK